MGKYLLNKHLCKVWSLRYCWDAHTKKYNTKTTQTTKQNKNKKPGRLAEGRAFGFEIGFMNGCCTMWLSLRKIFPERFGTR